MFICAEGLDGAGKTSLVQGLANSLENQGKRVFLTRSPFTETLGSEFKSILEKPLREETKFLLFLSSFTEQQAVIQKRLDEGYTVIADRYIYSALVYQDLEEVFKHTLVKHTINCYPDAVFLLDVGREIAFLRISKRTQHSVFESYNLFERRRRDYLALAERLGWHVLNGENNPDAVLKDAKKVLHARGI